MGAVAEAAAAAAEEAIGTVHGVIEEVSVVHDVHTIVTVLQGGRTHLHSDQEMAVFIANPYQRLG